MFCGGASAKGSSRPVSMTSKSAQAEAFFQALQNAFKSEVDSEISLKRPILGGVDLEKLDRTINSFDSYKESGKVSREILEDFFNRCHQL